MNTFIKIDGNTVQITTPTNPLVETITLDSLKQKLNDALSSLNDFEAWVLTERENRKVEVDACQADFDQATQITNT